jgi:alpha-D-ribose 1-methylphosphonate 5-triphosphate synthase subunit PhnI
MQEDRAKTALSQSVETMAINDQSLVGNEYAYMPQSVAHASNHVIAFPDSVNQSGIVDLNLSVLANDHMKRKVFVRSVRY